MREGEKRITGVCDTLCAQIDKGWVAVEKL